MAAEQLRRSLRVATEPPRKSPGKRIQVTQARVGKKDTLLKKLIRLVSSNIYSNVLKAQPERKILMMLTVSMNGSRLYQN